MTTNWDAIDDALINAEKETDKALDSLISSLKRMTKDNVEELFPSSDEREKFVTLMNIVNTNAAENEKIDRLVENIQKIGSTVIKVLTHFL